jgi:hypothetical protein
LKNHDSKQQFGSRRLLMVSGAVTRYLKDCGNLFAYENSSTAKGSYPGCLIALYYWSFLAVATRLRHRPFQWQVQFLHPKITGDGAEV